MNVEFIGLPGSGKTTLRRRLLASVEESEASRLVSAEVAYLEVARSDIDTIFRWPMKVLPQKMAMNLGQRMWYRSAKRSEAQVEFLAKYGAALGIYTGSEAYTKMTEDDRGRVIESFLETGSFWQFLNVAQLYDRIVLFGEGLVQKSFMFVDHAHRNVDQSEVIAYLENIPLPDRVVHVKASIEESFERMVKRPDGLTQRLKQADDSAIRRFLEAAELHLDLVSSWLAERHPQILINVDNHDDLTPAIDELRTSIESL